MCFQFEGGYISFKGLLSQSTNVKKVEQIHLASKQSDKDLEI